MRDIESIEELKDYKEEVKNYYKILNEFMTMQENDIATAYKLHKFALAYYERFSFILYEYKVNKGKPAIKARLEDMLKVLNHIYTSCRMVFGRGKEEIKKY